MRKQSYWESIRQAFGFGRRETPRSLLALKRRSLRMEPLEQRQLLAVLYWDPDVISAGNNYTTGAGLGGTANWTKANAWVDAAGTRYTWSGARSDQAVFWGTAGTVTVNTTGLSAGKIKFQTDGYDLYGANTLTITGGGVSINATASADIHANIAITTSDAQWSVADDETMDVYGGVTFTNRISYIQGHGATTFYGALTGYDFRANAEGTTGSVTFAGSSSLTATYVSAGNIYSGYFFWNSTGTLTTSILYVGADGSTGEFTQTNGTVTTSTVRFGTGIGTYHLDGGTLQMSDIVSLNTTHTLWFGGGTLKALGTFTADASLSYSVTDGVTSTINTQSYNVTLPGDITGSGSLTKTGTSTSTLILSGNNSSYTGTTTVSYGVLKAGSSTALGGENAKVVVSNAANGYLDLNGQTIGDDVRLEIKTVSGSASAIQNSSASTASFAGDITLTGSVFVGAGNGNITLTGDITQQSTGYYLCVYNTTNLSAFVLTLSGDNSFSRLAVGKGTVVLGSSDSLDASTQVDFSNSGILNVNGFSVTIADFFSQPTYTGAVQLGGGNLTFGDDTNRTFNGVISGTGSIVKQGTGTETFTGANTYTGTTTISAGTLQIGDGGATGSLDSGSIVVNGTLMVNLSAIGLELNSVISGSGTLIQNSEPYCSLLLGASNTFSGTTRIVYGMIMLENELALQNSMLDMHSGDSGILTAISSVTSATLGGLTGSRNLVLENSYGDALALTVGNNNADSTYSGVLSGSGSLTKTGTGVLTLSGANTYTGTTTIIDGAISASNIVVSDGASNLGNAASAVVLGDATHRGVLSYTGNNANYARGFTVNAGGGEIDVTTTGQTLTVGTNGISNGGPLTVGGIGDTTISSAISGTGSLTKIGTGTLTLSGANTYTGGTIVNGGEVQTTMATGQGNYISYVLSGLESDGRYELLVTWDAALGNSAHAAYQVFDGTEQVGTVLVDQQSAPSGQTIDGQTYQSLGQWTSTAGSLTVKALSTSVDPVSVGRTRAVQKTGDDIQPDKLYKISIDGPIHGESGSYIESSTVACSSEEISAASWQDAVMLSLSGNVVVGGQTLPIGENSMVDYVSAFDNVSGNDLADSPISLSPETKVIVFEDSTDGDYDDDYWLVTVTEVTHSPNTDQPVPDDPSRECSCGCPVDTPQGAVNDGSTTTEVSGASAANLLTPSYNSASALRPVITTDHTFAATAAVPDYIVATLTFNGVDGDPVYYDASSFDMGDTAHIALQADASSLSTGHYAYTLHVVEHRTIDGVDETQTSDYTGTHDVVNRTQSEFGDRWWLDDLDMLVVGQDGVMLVKGDNTAGWIAADGNGGYVGFNGSTLVENQDGSFTLTHREGGSDEFNASGLLTSRIDAQGNETTFAYTSGKISSITDPLGRVTTFAYSGGLVSTITDPFNRITTLTHLGSKVTSITLPDPDGAGGEDAPVWSYEYDAGGRGLMTEVTNPNDASITYEYDFAGQFHEETYPNSATRVLTPVDLVGLVDLTQTGYDVGHLASLPSAADAVATRTDQYSADWTYTTDSYGFTTSATDALGQTTLYERDSAGRITRITEPDPDGAGSLGQIITEYQYDGKGNLIEATYAVGTADEASESWEYDATWNVVDRHVDELGHITTYVIAAGTGLVTSMTQVVGSEGGGDDVTTSYTYTDGTGTYAALPVGLLLTETDPLGRVTQYAYGTSGGSFGRLTSITYADGTADEATVSYEYDARGNQTASIDELGNRTTYTYNALDQMVSMTEADPDGAGPLTASTTTYQYDGLGNMTTATNADGVATVTTYCPLGVRQTSVTQNYVDGTYNSAYTDEDVKTIYGYDAGLRLTSVTDPLGVVTHYQYDDVGRVVETILNYVDGIYNANYPDEDVISTTDYYPGGQVWKTTDALGIISYYEYDTLGRTTCVVQNYVDGAYNSAYTDKDIATTYTYDDAGQLLTTTDPLGIVTHYEYDDLGRLVETIQNYVNGVFNSSYPDEDVITSSTYDKAGNLLTVTDALSNVTSYEYDARNRLVEITQADPDGEGALTSPVTTYVYNDANQLVSVTDPLGHATSYAFDGRGRQTTVTLPDPDGGGTQTSPVTTTVYDDLNRVVSTTDAESNITEYDYDDLGRLILTTDAEDGETEYAYDAGGQLTSVTDPLDNTTTYDYDDLGRQASITDALDNETTYTYDLLSRVLTVTDPLDNVTTYAYDNLGRQTSVTDAEDGVTSYTYDTAGNLLTLTDSDSNTTTYVYDDLNRVIEETNELDRTRYYVYNAAGLLVQKTDRNGHVTTYEYDNLYRETEENWLDSSQNVIYTCEYTYNALSQVLSVEDDAATYENVYDNLGRVTQQTQTFSDSPTIVLTYQYDANGNVTETAATIGGTADYVIEYTYDDLGRATSIQQHGVSGGNAVAEKRIDLTYDADSRYATITYYNDTDGLSTHKVMTATYTYDDVGQLTGLVYTDANSVTIRSFSWVYNDAGWITSHDSDISSEDVTAYTYDATGQLLTADYASTSDESYTYDENGNRVTANGDTYTTGDNNQTTSDGTYSYLYDSEGNLVAKYIDEDTSGTLNTGDTDVTAYTWDYRNRLTNVSHYDTAGGTSDMSVDYVYDALNRRITRTLDADGAGVGGTSTEHYVWDGTKVMLDLLDADGSGETYSPTPETRYLWGQAVDQLFAQETIDDGEPEDVLYPVIDNLHSVRSLVEYDGDIAATYSYDTYGNVMALVGSVTDSRFFYTCQEYDLSTDLYYYNARWYDPATGKFISEDPIGYSAGDANLYRYCGNGPIIHVDPTGLWTKPKRDSKESWASTCAEAGDTWASLADMLHLEVNEYQKWIHEGPGLPASPKVGTTYHIPNVVIVYTSKRTGTDWWSGLTMANGMRDNAIRSGQSYAAKNYKVICHLAENSESDFENYWKTNGIFAFAFGGHGGAGDDDKYVGYVAETGIDSSVPPSLVKPPYKLQAIGAYFCGSADQISTALPRIDNNGKPLNPPPPDTMSWRYHVSSSGSFVGYEGAVNRFNVYFRQVAINPGFIPD